MPFSKPPSAEQKMSDDIAACPHSLAERETAVADGMCPICSADALSRLTTPPLPETAREKAETIEQELRVHGIDFDNNRRLALEIIAKFFVAPPLPAEIAGLIKRANDGSIN